MGNRTLPRREWYPSQHTFPPPLTPPAVPPRPRHQHHARPAARVVLQALGDGAAREQVLGGEAVRAEVHGPQHQAVVVLCHKQVVHQRHGHALGEIGGTPRAWAHADANHTQGLQVQGGAGVRSQGPDQQRALSGRAMVTPCWVKAQDVRRVWQADRWQAMKQRTCMGLIWG